MREIKFRAWDKATKKMYEVIKIDFYNEKVGYLFADPITQGEAIGYFKISDIDLMEYTGLKDKNGKEIFEGDILDFVILEYGGGEIQYKGYVIIDEYGTFIKTDPDGDEFTETFDLAETVINDDEIEIVGNIYEDIDLLEVENE